MGPVQLWETIVNISMDFQKKVLENPHIQNSNTAKHWKPNAQSPNARQFGIQTLRLRDQVPKSKLDHGPICPKSECTKLDHFKIKIIYKIHEWYKIRGFHIKIQVILSFRFWSFGKVQCKIWIRASIWELNWFGLRRFTVDYFKS